MGFHERAWTGLNLLVFGRVPITPMRLEQAIAAAAPSQEVAVDSFENYEDALDHCKSKRNVGFIFLIEDSDAVDPASTFRELAKAYQSKGWPCFGTLLHNGSETLRGHRALRDDPYLISYQPLDAFLDPSRTASSLNATWESFNAAFERSLVPLQLQETLISLARDVLDTDSIQFMDRVSALLSSNLNVSWLETVAMRWSPILNAVAASHPQALEPHTMLRQICALADASEISGKIEEISKTNLSLARRVLGVTARLENLRRSGELQKELLRAATFARPGAPALLRHLAQNRDRILSIAASVEASRASEAAG